VPVTGETYGAGAGSTNDLLPAGPGVYVPLAGMQVTLPEAGTYRLEADVRAAIGGTPPLNAFITARLFNVTAGTPLPDSARIVIQANVQVSGNDFAEQSTIPITEEITVTGPTTIRVEATHIVTMGTVTVANSQNSPTNGRTRLAYERIRP
jgi:hypothetical protein